MQTPPLDPDVADLAPTDPTLTAYDEQHVVTYLRLLDAEADNADWREVARFVLHIDPVVEPNRARQAFESHLARAKWLTSHGYRHLLPGGVADQEK
jgi:T6SS, Transcription factor, DNA binding domain